VSQEQESSRSIEINPQRFSHSQSGSSFVAFPKYLYQLVFNSEALQQFSKAAVRKELSQQVFSEDDSYIVLLPYVVWQAYVYAGQYEHNVVALIEAVKDNCVFTISHACDVAKMSEWSF
jgi:hypothetical protein